MSKILINDLVIATNITGGEFLVLDNVTSTKRTTINSLSSIYALKGSTQSTTTTTSDPRIAPLETTVRSLTGSVVNLTTSAQNSVYDVAYLNNQFISLSSSFKQLTTNVTAETNKIAILSSLNTYLPIVSAVNNSNFTIALSSMGNMITYTGMQNITAFITNNINVNGFVSTVAQLSTGTITIALSSTYSATRIAYNNSFTTAGVGAVASLMRVSNNQFLITGLLQ